MDKQSIRILIVEANEEDRQRIHSVLDTLDLEDGQILQRQDVTAIGDAIRELSVFRPHIIITDVRVSGDGLRLIGEFNDLLEKVKTRMDLPYMIVHSTLEEVGTMPLNTLDYHQGKRLQFHQRQPNDPNFGFLKARIEGVITATPFF